VQQLDAGHAHKRDVLQDRRHIPGSQYHRPTQPSAVLLTNRMSRFYTPIVSGIPHTGNTPSETPSKRLVDSLGKQEAGGQITGKS
jgi:hypothetical protein